MKLSNLMMIIMLSDLSADELLTSIVGLVSYSPSTWPVNRGKVGAVVLRGRHIGRIGSRRYAKALKRGCPFGHDDLERAATAPARF